MESMKRRVYTFKLLYFLNCHRYYKATDIIYYSFWWSNTLSWIMITRFHKILYHRLCLLISKDVFSFCLFHLFFFLYMKLYFISAIRWQLLCESTWAALHGLYHYQKSMIRMQPYYMHSSFFPYISECMS